MISLRIIDSLEPFKIHKRFANFVPSLPDYFVKTIGVDVEPKRKKNIKHHRIGKVALKDALKKGSLFLHTHLVKKRKKRKAKRKPHENSPAV